MRAALLLIGLVLAPAPARADGLLLTLSTPKVVIASNFQGGEVTLFGAAVDASGAVQSVEDYDLVVTTRGPAETLTVREKSRSHGLWLNRSGREFREVPYFLNVLSSRPLDEITDFQRRREGGLGLDAVAAGGLSNALTPLKGDDAKFSAALRRLQERRLLWREDASGVEVIGSSLFKGAITLPPNVPFGDFSIEARLMRAGVTVATGATTFRVAKDGFEARVAGLAETNRAAYGAATVALALLFGWLASVMFRRD
ncbi:TIGR02186 family protein [Hansschlegelia zhihuaiae]|uniref:TIGR02186 family protein n=1 Tax=Hansschlegelia zhihuaiae TaxID=405005 RepID=A0A4V1KJV6_9HYPH|nr:TIGR02186 family protein [Hansschlegelia zhihuaiae]RXF75522.1 hypothetical protein EK403_01310 [Hansschlegelia zhihuaiae]